MSGAIVPLDQNPDEGVWVVWGSTLKDYMMGLFPGDQELQARRFSDEAGFGWVEFVRFGDQS